MSNRKNEGISIYIRMGKKEFRTNLITRRSNEEDSTVFEETASNYIFFIHVLTNRN